MKRDAISGRVQHETKSVQGEDSKDKVYSSEQTFPDEVAASDAFAESKLKLLHVNWLSGYPTLRLILPCMIPSVDLNRMG